MIRNWEESGDIRTETRRVFSILLQVAWLRVDTQTILTIASHVITKNHRIAVSHSDHRTWFLHIREVKESDRGWYMCQINTDPMKSQTGYLEVVGKLNSLCSNRTSFLVSLYNFPPGKRVTTREHEMKKSILFLIEREGDEYLVRLLCYFLLSTFS